MPVGHRMGGCAGVPHRRWTRRGTGVGVARLAVGLTVLVVLALTPLAAAASSPATTPEERLAAVERRLGELDRSVGERSQQLAADEARLDELSVQLEGLGHRLKQARSRERATARQADDARVRARRTADRLTVAESRLQEVEDQLEELARRAYVHGRTSVDPVMVTIAALGTSGDQLADRLHLLERTVGTQATSVELALALKVRLEALGELAAAEQGAAADAVEQAALAAAEVADTHAEVLELTATTSRTLAEGRQRLDEAERERARLEAEQEQLRASQAAERQARQATERATRQSRSAAGVPEGGLVTVRGITVAAAIGPAVEALLDAAAADGIVLGGYGYRSPEVTAQLRRANGCPDVYESPASACRIPTARPGTSEHEAGLAIDFTWRRQTLCYPRPAARCSGNAAFEWLRANAARFGFHNLPSEAWHWSTTGR